MRNSIFHPLALAVAFVLAGLSGCKEEKAAPSKRPLLVDKVWAVARYELNGADITDDMDECELDDTNTFSSNGLFREDAGDLLCDEFDEDVEGTWMFKGNESILSITTPGDGASDLNIEELSQTTLRLSQQVPALGGELVIVMEAQ